MRILLLLAMAGLAACSTAPTESVSEQPAAAPAPAAAVAPAPAAAPAAPATPAAAPAPATQEEAEWRPPAGYKARVENGNRVYCRKTTVLGSRFAKDVCMTEAQLRDFEASNEGMRQNKDQTSRMCAGGGACQAQ